MFLLTFTTVAHAAAAAEPADGSLLDLARPIYDAFLHGQYIYSGCLALVFAVALARRFGTARYPWLSTDAGSAALVLAGSFGGAMVTQITAGAGVVPTWPMAETALKIAFGAAGGYSVLKALVVHPYLEKLADKGPRWLHAPMALVLWIFQEAAPDAPTPPAPPATPSAP